MTYQSFIIKNKDNYFTNSYHNIWSTDIRIAHLFGSKEAAQAIISLRKLQNCDIVELHITYDIL
jgi:hypothetical protein